ncbi:MAG: T9SS type B sorting domain-containing protein, partial [Altibacter sp.]|nr:T9SS type B sorting domain-containing protein [Altibacter sp.]
SAPLRECDYNNPGDGFETFDLTEVEPEVLNGLDPANYDIYYYEQEVDAIAAGDSVLAMPPGDFSMAIGTPGAYQNVVAFSQTVYVLVVGNAGSVDPGTTPASTGESCYSIVALDLIVDPLPVVVQAAPYELCDDEVGGSTPTDQLSTFDLTSRIGEITGGNLNYQVMWFETLADEASDTPIATPGAYQNRTIAPATQPTPQTIIARVTNQFGCKRLTTLTLVVLANPSSATPTPLEVCDDNNDGFADFTLTDKDLEIANGETDVTVLYYQTQAEAEAGVSGTELLSPYTNDDPFTDVVWARVTRIVTPPSTSPACYSVVALDLIVNLLPDAPVSGFGDLISCDTTGGGSAVFNLEDNTPFVTGGTQLPPDYSVSYHTSFADADGGINAIINTTAYTSGGETIWVRLQENATGCGRISSFDLIVGVYPLINDPADKAVCDDQASGSDTDGVTLFDLTSYNSEITGFNPDLTVFYYETPADQAAGTAISPATSYANTATPQTLYVSVFNSTGCEARTTLTISVLPVPVAADPTPLVVCDDDNDGIALFDLTSKDAEITSAMGATVTYHESQSDANNGVFPISSPYQNIVANVQPVWARVAFTQAPNTSGCYTVVTFDLIVNPSPLVPNSLPSLVACDQGTTSVFDLTVYEPTLLDLQPVSDPPVSYSFSYHTSLANATAGTPMITTPTMYTNTVNPQTIWVRLESGGNGCFAIVSFTLQVNTGPLANAPTPLSECDDLGEPNDGVTLFDLTAKSDEITGGAAGVEAYYYESQQNALDDENRIVPATAYANTSNPQTVYVRVFDTNTECENFTSLELRVVPNPQPNTPDPIEKCDYTDAGDEKEFFDLTIREGQISTNPNVVFSYHESYQQAVDNDPIAGDITMYENLENPQTIYVRVTNNASVEACFEIVELLLVVNALPDATAQISDLVVCEVDNDGFAFFDLTDRIDEILNGQDPLIHQVSFYETPGDAASGSNPIGDVTNYQNDGSVSPPGQPIYVGILNTQTTCYIASEQDAEGNYSLTFNLQVLEGVIANALSEPYVLCDQEGPNDGYTVFDLSLIGLEVLGGQPYDVDFYESLEQAQLGDTANALPDAYTNIINPQVIYARVTHPETGCFDITEVTLKVEQLPLVVLDETYRLCVDANGNPIDAEEGGASPPVIDTGLEATLYSFEWQLDGVTLLGQNGPSIIALEGGVYTVIVTENATGCSMEVTTTVIVSSPPITYSAEVTSGAFASSHTIDVMVTGDGDYVFQLDNGPFQEESTFTDVDPGVHVVTIKDANGCGSVSLEVSIIDYPRFVTPNQDGYHDTWNIIGIAGGDPTAKIYIFDRFGKLLKQISPQGPGWDGTYNGNPLPSSDYWFVVEYKENETQKEFKGHFTLKR